MQYRARNKPTQRLAAWLAHRVEAAGNSLFRENDALARRHGWHIGAGHAGLSRVYRDPRFDQLASCRRCRGRGSGETGEPCPGCLGTGRVELGSGGAERAQPSVPERSQVQ
jgi:hypothetical protein